MKLVTLLDALKIAVDKAENWIRYDQLPVPVERSGRGRTVFVKDNDIEALAIWLMLADAFGPSRADVAFEYNGCSASFIQIRVGCLSARIDLRPVREAILSAERSERLEERAA